MITKTICGCTSDPIFIGRKGENLATQICFDVPEDLAEYTYTVYVKRPREHESYPAANISRGDDCIIWTVSNVDTAISGEGSVQIRFTEDETIVKTMVYRFEVGKAIDVDVTDAPTWYDTWLDALTALAEAAHADAEDAAESADNASESETNASTSETNASNSADAAADSAADALYYANLAAQSAESAGYITVEVDPDTMQLQVTTTTDLSNDLTLSVNADTGILEVIIS